MVRSLPSRTAAIIPHPHEQKLHEVVNSLTSESFRSCVAARISATSRSPPKARPDPPPTVSLNRSLRLMVELSIASPSSVGGKAADPGLWARLDLLVAVLTLGADHRAVFRRMAAVVTAETPC